LTNGAECHNAILDFTISYIAGNGKEKPMMRKSDERRHILALSGGKDSAALAAPLKGWVPQSGICAFVLIKRR
jgi:tRNA(Ile)-lysidine synthase TilS/MesJ